MHKEPMISKQEERCSHLFGMDTTSDLYTNIQSVRVEWTQLLKDITVLLETRYGLIDKCKSIRTGISSCQNGLDEMTRHVDRTRHSQKSVKDKLDGCQVRFSRCYLFDVVCDVIPVIVVVIIINDLSFEGIWIFRGLFDIYKGMHIYIYKSYTNSYQVIQL